MNITIHRGNQIGGCITEITSSGGTKILIDLGHNLPEGGKPSADKYDNQDELERLLHGVSAIFYTHPHGDHMGFEARVPKGIKQYIGATSKEMLLVLRDYMTHAPKLEAEAKASYVAVRDFHTYKVGVPIYVGDGSEDRKIKVTPFYVSHSAADAYMLLVECDNKSVLHTGDFREHGYRGKGLLPTIEKYIAHKGIDVLITEGTMLGRGDERVMSEERLQEEAFKLMSEYDNMFVMCSSVDADRLASFHHATAKVGRRLIVDAYQWRQMKVIEDMLGNGKGGWKYRYPCRWYYNKHRAETHESVKTTGATFLVRNTPKFREMIDEVYPMMNPGRTCFIYSQFKGYVQSDHPAFQQSTYDFLHYKDWHIECLHTSGHASKETLAAVCTAVSPRSAILPIHRDAGSDFRLLAIPQELKDKVVTEARDLSVGGIGIKCD